ncbi:hypothetical protein CspeluHIS016_0109700 [Cutaneotrichosporon spelunceum]|uniref:Uncharacterized protein n=1 Tax=Cutaneotrichosporon spelunceum TaxID=1672016 RepID=A0AAD3YA61_9TREE|nr:hypothetical protein CspeluHIS016_0109700 [Cutaneotrichosporon spelunceum]
MVPQRMPVGRPSADAPVSVVDSDFSDLFTRHPCTDGLPPIPTGQSTLTAYPISPQALQTSLVSRPLPALLAEATPSVLHENENESPLTPSSSPTLRGPLTPSSRAASPTPVPSPTRRPPTSTSGSINSRSYASHSACSVDPTTPTSLVLSRSPRPSLPPPPRSMAISRPTLTRSLPSDSYERYTRPRDAPPRPTTRPFSWGLSDVDLLPTISPRRAPSSTSCDTEELFPPSIPRPVSVWLGWSPRTPHLSRGWSFIPKKKPQRPASRQTHPTSPKRPPTSYHAPPSPTPHRPAPVPSLSATEPPSSRSSPISFSGHIAANVNLSGSLTESDRRVAAWLDANAAARSRSDDTHVRSRPSTSRISPPSIYAVLRDEDGSERTLGPWPLPPRRLILPTQHSLPPLISTPSPPIPSRVYDYPAVAGWSADDLRLGASRSPFGDRTVFWQPERKRARFDTLCRLGVAMLAYLLALFGRRRPDAENEHLGPSIHSQHMPDEELPTVSGQLIRVPNLPI